jgi:beta-fructofuranosidase
MSLPLIATMRNDGRLALEPAHELEKLRGAAWTISDLPLEPDTMLPLEIAGDALEIDVTFKADMLDDFGIAVRCSPDGAEQTRIVVKPERSELHVERSFADANPLVMPLEIEQALRLRIFVDASTLEIFTADGRCLATRFYPQRTDSTGVRLFTAGAPVDVRRLSAWTMTSIW